MRGKSHRTKLLAAVPLFSSCSERELSRLGSLMTEVDVPAGEVLCREGAPGRECYLVAEGIARATLRGEPLATLGPGTFFGEMALLDGGPRSATITAETAMRLYVLDPRSFYTLLEDYPGITRKVLKVLAERLREAEKAPTH